MSFHMSHRLRVLRVVPGLIASVLSACSGERPDFGEGNSSSGDASGLSSGNTFLADASPLDGGSTDGLETTTTASTQLGNSAMDTLDVTGVTPVDGSATHQPDASITATASMDGGKSSTMDASITESPSLDAGATERDSSALGTTSSGKTSDGLTTPIEAGADTTDAKDTETCSDNTCQCPQGSMACNNACISLSACCDDDDCPEGASCDDGECRCPNNTHECDGECVPNNSVESCGAACTACTVPTGGEATCDGTSCGARCPNGKQLCLGECIDNDAACNGSCKSGAHECGGLCVGDDDPTKCGPSCTTCTVPSNADALCASGTCAFECKSGFKRCGSTCVAESGCCTDNECVAEDPKCIDSTTLRTWSGNGTCSAGVCQPPSSTDTYCPGGCANGACQHDVWIPMTVAGAPAQRTVHTLVWADNLQPPKMIVWGGTGAGGGLYDPRADTWEAMSTTGAPSSWWNSTAVWSGAQLLVFGGAGNSGATTEGGRYTPGSGGGTWQPMSEGPGSRQYHTAVWTGAQMIVAGGTSNSGSTLRPDAYVYDPISDLWSKWNSNSFNNEAPRHSHCAVWTGSQMLLFGGDDAEDGFYSNTGQIFDPNARNTFPVPALPTTGITARSGMACVWSGTQLIVWGGENTSGTLNTGGRISPTASSWTALPSANAPTARTLHTAVWTGTKMIVWGGLENSGSSTPVATGAQYDPATNTWTPITPAPFPRWGHRAVWTGNEMIVWGGNDGGGALQTGYKYVP